MFHDYMSMPAWPPDSWLEALCWPTILLPWAEGGHPVASIMQHEPPWNIMVATRHALGCGCLLCAYFSGPVMARLSHSL
eukprot:c26097_g1_i1 orf=300-536(+)